MYFPRRVGDEVPEADGDGRDPKGHAAHKHHCKGHRLVHRRQRIAARRQQQRHRPVRMKGLGGGAEGVEIGGFVITDGEKNTKTCVLCVLCAGSAFVSACPQMAEIFAYPQKRTRKFSSNLATKQPATVKLPNHGSTFFIKNRHHSV